MSALLEFLLLLRCSLWNWKALMEMLTWFLGVLPQTLLYFMHHLKSKVVAIWGMQVTWKDWYLQQLLLWNVNGRDKFRQSWSSFLGLHFSLSPFSFNAHMTPKGVTNNSGKLVWSAHVNHISALTTFRPHHVFALVIYNWVDTRLWSTDQLQPSRTSIGL